ncbi:MAG: histidine--tRNA ligase [Deltaproteobacteria bacterium]|nr:histidine--tRNA ligase [Deltaproteobacteria bacterium]MBW2387630.1 histidine--tRNA ligase [Deltaproteobacteria bacterium]
MSKQNLKPPRGTRDLYPEDQRFREWLFGHFREIGRRFAFEEVDAPIVEHAELFMRKAGEEIVDQLYHFELHGRHLALRPEMTPSIARMVMARAGGLRMPIRWFTITQNWRYERMSRGRKREHYQWNMDIYGEPSVTAEAELIAAVVALVDAVGLAKGDVKIRLNSRGLLEDTLRAGALRDRPEVFESLCVVIDKIGKIGPDKVVDMLVDPSGEVGLDPSAAREVVQLLSLSSLDDAIHAAPKDSTAGEELQRLWRLLEAYGIDDRMVFDASVVRGLAYYTGVVFEAFDTGGDLRSICGGGRYDRLTSTLGGPEIPAVGFGFGDVVIGELLSDKGRLPELPRVLDDVVFAFGDEQRPAAIEVANKLRAAGRRVELILGSPKLKRVIADADRDDAKNLWMLGPDELSRGVVKCRALGSGVEREEDIASFTAESRSA